jgi:capsular exopolysaccharide synthesis family protein
MSRVEEALNRARGKVRVVSGSQSRGADLTVFTREDSAETPIIAYPAEQPAQEPAPAEGPVKVPNRAHATLVQPHVPGPSLVPPPAERASAAPPTFHLSEAVQGKVVISRDTSAISVEQYRRLAATLHGLHVSAGLKTIMVSSALPRDGKTLTTTNLALTLSESYSKRVLVIDADLRRPSIHEVFGLENNKGLADGLRVGATGSLSVTMVSPTLTVLTAGAPDPHPMAGLTSERMAAILTEAAARFDWVLLDTPPIGLLADAQLLAGLVDGVLLVVGAGSTDHVAVTKTINAIGRERILGVVLNRVQHQIAASSHYDDYYHTAGAPFTGSRR